MLGNIRAFSLSTAAFLPKILYGATIVYVALRDVVNQNKYTNQYAYELTHLNVGNSTDLLDARMPTDKSFVTTFSNSIFGSTAFYLGNTLTSLASLTVFYIANKFPGNSVMNAAQLALPTAVNIIASAVTYGAYRENTEYTKSTIKSSIDIRNHCSGFEEQPRTAELINSIRNHKNPTKLYQTAEWASIGALVLGAYNVGLVTPSLIALAGATLSHGTDDTPGAVSKGEFTKAANRLASRDGSGNPGNPGDHASGGRGLTATGSGDGGVVGREEHGRTPLPPTLDEVAAGTGDGVPSTSSSGSGRTGETAGGDEPSAIDAPQPVPASSSSLGTPEGQGVPTTGDGAHNAGLDPQPASAANLRASVSSVQSTVSSLVKMLSTALGTAVEKGFKAIDVFSLSLLLPFTHANTAKIEELAAELQYQRERAIEFNIANDAVTKCIPRLVTRAEDGATLTSMNPKVFLENNWNCSKAEPINAEIQADGIMGDLVYIIASGNCTELA